MVNLKHARGGFFAFRCVSLLIVAVGRSNASIEDVNHGEALVSWLRSKGGFLHENIEFRRFENMYGLFASGKIPEDEIIMNIPQEIILKPTVGHVGDRVTVEWDDGFTYGGYITAVHPPAGGDDKKPMLYDIKYDADNTMSFRVERDFFEFEALPTQCATVRMLVEEMELGDDSKYSAYVNYLKDQAPGQLPAAWSAAGQDLTEAVFGNFPPFPGLTGWLASDWMQVCRGDPEHLQAAALVNQRSWDEVLIPVYDMMSHRNGK